MTPADFKRARNSLALSQKQTGLLLGMPQNAVSRIESGDRQPTRQHAAAIRLLLFLQENKLLEKYLSNFND